MADAHFAETITNEMAESAKARGTGIARRSPEYVKMKMGEGKAVIATTPPQVDMIVNDYSAPAELVHMIPPGYDDNRFYPVSAASQGLAIYGYPFPGCAMRGLL